MEIHHGSEYLRTSRNPWFAKKDLLSGPVPLDLTRQPDIGGYDITGEHPTRELSDHHPDRSDFHMKTLKAKDLINVGIFTALYFVSMAVGNFIAVFVAGLIMPGLSSLFIPALVGLVSGPVYMLMIRRVPRFGAITIVGVIMGLFLLVFGHFALSFIPYALCGLLADLTQSLLNGSRPNLARYLSYVILTFGCTGPVLPLWFMKDAYVASLVRRGKSQEYINGVFAPITGVTFLVCIVVTLAGALAGAWIGCRIVDRHFNRIPAGR